MPQIIILPHHELCPEGIVIEAQAGETVCSAMLANDVEIEHACEMSNACTTCHIYVREGFDSLAESDETEDDMLDKKKSVLGDTDLVVEIPKYTINQVSENH